MNFGSNAVATPAPFYYSAHLLILNFLIAYIITATRIPKMLVGLDHNVHPREDLTVRGPKAVEKGRITQAQLDSLKRLQAAHENSIEHFPIFAVAIAMATLAGVDAHSVNSLGAVYTLLRVAYVIAYWKGSSVKISWIRSVVYWMSNMSCLRLIWLAGVMINTTKKS